MWMTRVSINNPVFATMVMAGLMVLGLFSYARLNVEQLPDISPPVAFVAIAYPGASPAAVEVEVTKPVESALNSIAGVKMIRSNSFEGRSETVVEFSLDADMAEAIQEVRDRVARVQAGFPRDVKTPFVTKFDGDNAQPVAWIALLAGERDIRDVSLLAEQTIVKRFERVAGVARVQTAGLSARQVRIDLDPQRLRAYNLTPAEISAALARANSDQPVGLIAGSAEDALLRVEGRVKDPKAFARLIVARPAGTVVTLGDLGTIVEREEEPSSYSRINGQPAITLSVFKQQDANVVQTGDAVKAAIEELKPLLPAGVELRPIYISSDWVKNSLTGVQRTLIEGALLTVGIVFLFLHSWRSTVITGLTLPIAVIATFMAVYAFGFTLNFMTLMALSLCIGLLIDDAIVVRENIVRHLKMGKDHFTAAREGTQEIGLAVLATTFAICAVFVPVAFMKGIIGKFFYPFGITVTVAVLLSLFVSFTLDPMLSAVWKDPPSRINRWPVLRHLIAATDRFMDFLHATYERLIAWAFSPRRWRLVPLPAYGRPFDANTRRDPTQPRRWRFATITPRGVVMIAAALSFVVAVGLVPLAGVEGVPDTDEGFTRAQLKMPVGTSLERMDQKVRQVEAMLMTLPEVRTLSADVGGDGGRHEASISLALKDRSERQRSQKEVEEQVRKLLERVPGIESSVGNRPIYIAVLGPDPNVLDQITTDLSNKVRAIKGVTDLETSVKPGLPAFAVRLRPEAEKALGLNAAQVAATLRTYVNGEVATTWTTPDGQQVDVQLRLPQAQRTNVELLRSLPVAYAKDGGAISLESIATIEPVANPEVIKRQNLQRRQAIYAAVQGRSVGEVSQDIDKLIKSTSLPTGYSFDVGGQSEEIDEIFGPMLAALGLAVVFIYLVLASQFGSFIQPVAIMASLPLALLGVMLALLAFGSTLNIFSMIGLIMLMGLVTKNAILLVDYANHRRAEGKSVAQAMLEAGQVRMRPIIMTTAAMVFGMLPLALALNDGGELQAPMGRAIIGGVITSTLLTLVVVPVLYSYLVRERRPAPQAGGAAMPVQMPASKD
jgi:multidrug efflux pump subunit AcrB